MKTLSRLPVFVLAALLAPACASLPRANVHDTSSLHRALADAAPRTTVLLQPGHYRLEAVAFTDSACGNCEDAAEHVPATVGLRVHGRGITIAGTHRDSVVIHTNAGYGLLFDGCDECVLREVTVTGGARDPDGRATDAAIVVRRSTLRVEDCVIRDNIGDSAVVAKTIVGIAGIAVREDGDVTVTGCALVRNSWDGIALYRGARAHVHDNIIDGVDKAAGGRIGGGRGVGIGATWDARATVERNLVTRYWKGIGIFVEAEAIVRQNVVEDILTWGMALWGSDGATPVALMERNIVHRTGACGVMIDRPDGPDPAGALIGNLIVRTGTNERYDTGEPYCWQRAVARHGVPAGFVERDNILYANRQPVPAGAAPPPLPQSAALAAPALDLLRSLAAVPVLRTAHIFREELPARSGANRTPVKEIDK